MSQSTTLFISMDVHKDAIAVAYVARVKAWRLHPVGEALQALRGVQCTVAVTMVAEIGALSRCDPPRELRKFLGLIPAEHSTGERRRQGPTTKAGNPHARRVVGEDAWAYR